MANFEKAFNKLLLLEGYYSNTPGDKGEETFCGISRKFNPNWIGWQIIDETKDKSQLKNNTKLMGYVKQFYLISYWKYYDLDNYSQLIADEILEGSVNLGKGAYNRLLKIAINLLNRNQRLYKNIPINTNWDALSKAFLNLCIEKNGDKLVYNMLNFLQANHYINLMLNNEHNEKWIGWFNRVEIIK